MKSLIRDPSGKKRDRPIRFSDRAPERGVRELMENGERKGREQGPVSTDGNRAPGRV